MTQGVSDRPWQAEARTAETKQFIYFKGPHCPIFAYHIQVSTWQPSTISSGIQKSPTTEGTGMSF